MTLKVLKLVYSALYIVTIALAAMVPSSALSAGAVQNTDLADRISESIRKTVLQNLRTKGAFSNDDVMVTVSLALDTQKIAEALQSKGTDNAQIAASARDVYQAVLKAIKEAQAEAEANEPMANEQINLPDGRRFGPLNLDVLGGKDVSVRATSNTSQGGQPSKSPTINLAIQLPQLQQQSASIVTLDRFIDVAPFVRSAEVSISLPARIDEKTGGEVTELARRILSSLLPSGVSDNAKVDVRKMAPSPDDLKAEREAAALASQRDDPFKHLVTSILDPRNPSLSGLLNSAALLLGMLLASYGIWRAGSRLAQAVTALAPQATDEATLLRSSSGRNAGAELSDELRDSEASGQAPIARTGPGSSTFKPDAEARALVNDVERLRNIFSQAKRSDALTLAEALDELIRQDGGVEAAFRCALFVGELDFEDLITLLAPQQSVELRSYFAAQAHRAPQTLGGAEACRLLLAQWNSRQVELLSLGNGEMISEGRKSLLQLDDTNLLGWLIAETSSAGAQWAFGALTPQRMLAIMRLLPAEKARIFGSNLDQRLPNNISAARGAADSMRQILAAVGRKGHGRTRLVQRLIAQPALADEALVNSLFDGPDWDLRIVVAQKCYLFSDLSYLDASFLLGLIDRKKVSDRAAIMYLLPAELRNNLLSSYPNDSKALEVISLELATLDSNPKRRELIMRNRSSIVGDFMAEIRRVLQANPEITKRALRLMASTNGWPLPAVLEDVAASDTVGAEAGTGNNTAA